MKSPVQRILRFLALFLALIFAAAPAANAAGKDPVEINVIVALGGRFAALGQAQVISLHALEDVVNKGGGIQGRPVHFNIQDDTVTARSRAANRERRDGEARERVARSHRQHIVRGHRAALQERPGQLLLRADDSSAGRQLCVFVGRIESRSSRGSARVRARQRLEANRRDRDDRRDRRRQRRDVQRNARDRQVRR